MFEHLWNISAELCQLAEIGPVVYLSVSGNHFLKLTFSSMPHRTTFARHGMTYDPSLRKQSRMKSAF